MYPALLAGLEWLTGRPVSAGLLVQVVVGTATAALAYLIALEYFGPATALLAGVLLAVAPMTSRYASVVLTETLFTFLVVSAVWAWVRDRPVWSGALFGVATLTRASIWPFLALLAAVSVFAPGADLRRRLRIIAATALLVVAPCRSKPTGSHCGRRSRSAVFRRSRSR